MSAPKNKKGIVAKKAPSKTKKLLLKPIPLYIILLIMLPLLAAGYFIHKPKKAHEVITSQTSNDSGNYDACAQIVRQKDTSLIKPLLLVEINSGQDLMQTEAKINDYITQKKKLGIISTASVYLNDLNSANHIEINPDILYDPASLMKVAMLIIYLKEAETNPSLLKKRYTYENPNQGDYIASIQDKSLTPGQSYSVEDLLYYMIVYSDNQAFLLLAKHVDNNNFNIVTQDMGIPLLTNNTVNSENKKSFIANANSISRYFRVLYSATYMNRKMSQYALKLLTKSNYKEGLLKGIDPQIRVAHKFGERVEGGVAELHEFGIVYLQNHPYLIGVMTKGPDLKQLQGIVSDISKIAYDDMKVK